VLGECSRAVVVRFFLIWRQRPKTKQPLINWLLREIRTSIWRSSRSRKITAKVRSCVWGGERIVDIDVIPTGKHFDRPRPSGSVGFPRRTSSPKFSALNRLAKTTLALTVIAQAQKKARRPRRVYRCRGTRWILATQKRLGVNLDDLLVSQPSSGEEALRICETLVRSNALGRDCLGFRGCACYEGRSSKARSGIRPLAPQARLMSAALRKLTSLISKARTCCIFTNQIREKNWRDVLGTRRRLLAEELLKFYASMRVDIRRIGGN